MGSKTPAFRLILKKKVEKVKKINKIMLKSEKNNYNWEIIARYVENQWDLENSVEEIEL